jgi:hypothetical protein
MYLEENEDGEPEIIMKVIGLKDFDEAEELANELFSIITDEEPEKEILKLVH